MSIQKTITIKEVVLNELEQGSTFIDFHSYYSKFMIDPKFYHQVFHGSENVITFVSNEDLKTVKKNLNTLLCKLGEIIFDINYIYGNSIKEFENKIVEKYPTFSNVRIINDVNIHKKYVVFEWLSRTWMIYV
jgi:hypothetical protein